MTGTPLEPERNRTANPPLTPGPLGAHPIGTGLGVAAGSVAAGALAGTVAGPPGAVIGAAAGAVAGGVAGNKIARAIDPAAEEAYWRENFSSRPYVPRGEVFSEYRPAYGYGVDAYARREGRTFEQAEPELMRDWDYAKGISSLTWEGARHATRDAWQHVSDFVERATPGDSDHDGN